MEHYLAIAGGEYVVTFDAQVTSPYRPATHWQPAEGPEFEINVLSLREDRPRGGKESPNLELPEWLKQQIAQSIYELDGTAEKVSEARSDRDHED